MKKLICLLLIAASTLSPVVLFGADAGAGAPRPRKPKYPDGDIRNELPEAHLAGAPRSEDEIRKQLNDRIASATGEVLDDGDAKLFEEIAKKRLANQATDPYSQERAQQQGEFLRERNRIANADTYSEERAKQEGEFLAKRNAAVHQNDYSPERAQIEGEYLALREKAKRKNDGFFQKLPTTIEDGLLGAIGALVEKAGVTLGLVAYHKASKALASDTISPEEKSMLEKEAQWNIEVQRLERQMQHDATYMAFVKAALEADATKKATAQVEEEYKKFMKEKTEQEKKLAEEAKKKADAEMARKIALAEQQGPVIA